LDTRSEHANLRYELKLASDEAGYPELKMALRLHRAGIRTLYPTRVVQSLYLDTTYGRALQENLGGISEREKIRLRWYGDESRTVAGVLERKGRVNSLGWKEVLPLPAKLALAGQERRRFVRELARLTDARWRAHLATLEPVQWVRYRREYLTSADLRVRLTLDRELFFSDQRPLARISDAERAPRPRLLVLELKCGPEDLDGARTILEDLPVPLGRCSKFALASAPESGAIPSAFEV